MQPALVLAGDAQPSSWQNIPQRAAGQEIEITKTDGKPVRGTFVSLTDQSISLHGKQQDVTLSRTDVRRVQLRPAGRGKYTWIGLAVGAGAGAGVGAGIGESVSNQSGGDFGNLEPAIIGVCAGVGAGVGALVGSALGGRHTTIYVAR